MIVLRRVTSKCFTSKVVDCGGSPFGPPRAFGQLTVKLALEPVTVDVMIDNPLELRVVAACIERSSPCNSRNLANSEFSLASCCCVSDPAAVS